MTEGLGNQILAPRMEGGVKVYELTAEKIQWETEAGKSVEAWAYNGQVPGPQIRVREGDRVVFTAGVPFDTPGTTNLLKVETV